MLATLLALATMHPSVTVDGDSTCPRPAEVARRLAELMASVPSEVAADRARLTQAEGTLRIDLTRDDGTRIAERKLAVTEACDDLSAATAVIIATWEAQLRPQRVGRVPLTTTVAAPAPPPPAPPPLLFDVGVAPAVSLAAGADPALGATLVASAAPPRSALGLFAALSASAARDEPVSNTGGTIHWRRASLAVGARVRAARGRARVEAYAAALAGALSMWATGLATNDSDTSFRVGATAGVRAMWAGEHVAPWLLVGADAWPVRDELRVTNVGGSHDVPRLGVTLALGVSWGRF